MTRLYNENCAKCHGGGAEGGGAGTKSLVSFEKFSQDLDKPFFDAIKEGVPDMGMEAFGGSLSDAEIWGLVVHIRELQARGLREKFGSPKPDATGTYASQRAKFKVETVVDTDAGLTTPWSMDWLPDGRMLVTNRPGGITLFKGGKGTPIEGVPNTIEIGQGGLLDVAVHPDYAKNGWVYLSFTDPGKSPRTGMTKLVRAKLQFNGSGAKWVSQETIFELDQAHYNGSGVHFGSRIVFDRKGKVYFTIGERGAMQKAQDLKMPNGKVYRINEDGTIPADNPFAASADKAEGRIAAIWSYGHRNPQGLALDLQGNLWDTEHAPRGGDEVNLVLKGKNYGWPLVSFGINYSDAPFNVPWPKPDQDIAMPAYRWLPSTGACGLDTVRGNAFPAWKGDLVAGGLAGQNLDRLRMKDGKLVEREELLQGMGRIRDVVCGPDGNIYVALNQPDKIIRLVPAK